MRLSVGVGLIAAFLCAVATSCFAAEEAVPKRQIRVTGEAVVKVVPDEVLLRLGIETSDKILSHAKALSDQRVKAVTGALKKAGIDPKHMQTDFIHIQPRYKYDYSQQSFIGYFVQTTVEVTVKDIAKFESILTAALEAGANYVHGIQFRTSELRKHRDEARNLALKAAQEKANDMAASLNQKVGKPITIFESPGMWWSSYDHHWGSRRQAQAQNIAQEAGPADTFIGETTAPGQIGIKAQVQVTFELE
ncbi:MAG: SIMPL domain-containing protein [Thermodesulfobacteriota bacterium]